MLERYLILKKMRNLITFGIIDNLSSNSFILVNVHMRRMNYNNFSKVATWYSFYTSKTCLELKLTIVRQSRVFNLVGRLVQTLTSRERDMYLINKPP